MSVNAAFLTIAVTSSSFGTAEEAAGELGFGEVRTIGNTQIQSINASTKRGRSWRAFDVNIKGIAGATLNEGVAAGSMLHHCKISPTTSFNQTTSAEYGKDSTISNVTSDLPLQNFSGLTAQLGFNVAHIPKVLFVTVKKSDRVSAVNS